jgi:thymidine phosphorylase
MKVLRNDPDAPEDLRNKAIHLAGELLELTGRCSGEGHIFAERLLTSGTAYSKFEAIRDIQGRHESPPLGSHAKEISSGRSGRIISINNRMIGRIAQLVGAPNNPGAGVHLAKHVNDFVDSGDPLLTIYADSSEALNYAVRFWQEKQSFAIVIT